MGFLSSLFRPQITTFQKSGNLRIFGNPKNLGTDLVESSDIAACCSKCAMYRRRIYSLSGRDKRFPKIPDDFDSDCCGLNLHPYIWGVSEPTFSAKDPIKYSNRPFVDDRTARQKRDYLELKKQFEEEKEKEEDRKIYNRIVSALPNNAPKSFGAFRRMKKTNSPGYIDLKQRAAKVGIKL